RTASEPPEPAPTRPRTAPVPSRSSPTRARSVTAAEAAPAPPPSTTDGDEASPYPALAARAERLRSRDFATLTPAELAELSVLMRGLTVATPLRGSRRVEAAARGRRVDLRTTLRRAQRTGGFPVRLARRRPRLRRRRLVVLCDISGSMEPYARAMLQ